MATITIRIADEVREGLEAKADAARMNLSEYVRDVLTEDVAPRPGDEPRVEEGMSLRDRHTLALLHRILARVLPEGSHDVDGDRDDQLQRAKVLEDGFVLEYAAEMSHLQPELTARQCRFVRDVLDMFRMARGAIAFHIRHGESVDAELATSLVFGGFDHNDEIEGHMAEYVEHLVSTRRWEELKPIVEGPDRGNSHSPMLAQYSRMLSVYRQIVDSRTSSGDYQVLTLDQLARIDAASSYPTRG